MEIQLLQEEKRIYLKIKVCRINEKDRKLTCQNGRTEGSDRHSGSLLSYRDGHICLPSNMHNVASVSAQLFHIDTNTRYKLIGHYHVLEAFAQ